MNEWKGCIVEESLTDNRVLNNLKVVRVRITSEDKPIERWHIYDLLVSKEELNKLHHYIKDGWYMHFWKDKKILVFFKNKKFILDINKKETWKEAIDYGLSIKIPREQLDFKMEF